MKVEKFVVTYNCESIGTVFDSLRDAVLAAARYDGWGARYLRMEDNGDIHPSNPMRLFPSRNHIGNNVYIPVPADAFKVESAKKDDAEAEAEVAQLVFEGGYIHPRFEFEITHIVKENGNVVLIDGKTIEEILATTEWTKKTLLNFHSKFF